MQVVERNSGFLECLKQKNEKNNKVEVCQAVPTRMLKAPPANPLVYTFSVL